ncbi:MAG: caspase family protein [Candidatus Eremiobacteraeota bacterium]|nr:caspase family protein [Candidatus Eremiobacteraeota bacterium]
MKLNRCIVLAALLAAALLYCLPARPAPAVEQGRRWAIVIGINSYFKEVSPLHCAVNDARELKKALIEVAAFKDDDVFLLTSEQKGNRMPDKGTIIRWVSYIKSQAKASDTFLFFFSGHGMDMEKESYLLTMESDPYSKDTLEETSLKVSNLRRYLEEMPAGKKIIIIDACRNDPRSGKGDKDNVLTESFAKRLKLKGPMEAKPGSAVPAGTMAFNATFFSCSREQRSYEWSENSMGFFTYYLVQGLRGGAKNTKGAVTVKSLDEYLGLTVAQAVKRERGSVQAPWITLDGTSGGLEFALAHPQGSGYVVPSPATLTTEAPPPPVYATPALPSIAPVPPPGQGTLENDFVWAVFHKNMDDIKSLIARGADVNGRDINGISAVANLYNRDFEEYKPVLDYILQHGADINTRDSSGQTILHRMASGDTFPRDFLEYLITHKIDINAADNDGYTALHWAVTFNNEKITAFLISKKASINMRNKSGDTPLGIASIRKYEKITRMLREAGAKE